MHFLNVMAIASLVSAGLDCAAYGSRSPEANHTFTIFIIFLCASIIYDKLDNQ